MSELPKAKAAATIYRDPRKGWRWRVKGRNGKKLAVSSEGYRRKIDLINAMDLTRVALSRWLSSEEDTDK